MSAEERLRYDRQIRLWGLTAQQRLMQTALTFYGIDGAASEVAKNMVLAGVKSVTVVDPSPVTREDLNSSFLLQPLEGAVGDNTRGAVACARLQALNPFVSVSCDTIGAVTAGASDSDSVALIQAATLRAAQASLQRANDAKLVVVSFPLGAAVTLSFILAFTSDEAVTRSLSSAEALSDKPAAFQKVALALHLRAFRDKHAGVSFSQQLAHAVVLVETLRLFALEPQDVEAVLATTEESTTPAAVDAVSATLAGASLAQYLIQLISADGASASGTTKPVNRWMLCDASSMSVLVGDL